MTPELPVEELELPQEGQEDPEAQEQPYGPNNEKLPLKLVNALSAIVRKSQEQDMFIRRRELMWTQLKHFYDKGYQHLQEDSRTGMFIGATPGGIITNAAGEQLQCPSYIDDYNIFTRYLLIQEAVLGENPPGVDFRPINADRQEDVEAAAAAEKFRKYIDRTNDMKAIQTQIVRSFGLDGRTCAWSRSEVNVQTLGRNESEQGKQSEVVGIYGVLEHKVFPMVAKDQSQLLGCIIYRDLDVAQAKAENPGSDYEDIPFADKIKGGTASIGESTYDRTARLAVLQGINSRQQIGEAFSYLVTETHVFLRPAAFNCDLCTKGQDSPTLKEQFEQLFPKGCHIKYEGDVYVGSWNQSLDRHINIGFPYEGDGMFRPSIMDPMVIVQDRYNDNMNAAAEVFDHGWPSTWIMCEDQDFDAIRQQTASPFAIRQLKNTDPSRKATDSFFREPNPEVSTSFIQHTTNLANDLPQFMLASQPALIGAQTPDNKTAHGYAQATSNAKGQQGLVWQVLQKMMAGIYENLAMCAASNPDHEEEIVIPGEAGALQLTTLRSGNWGCYPDEDSAFPESTSSKRQVLTQLITMAAQSPIISAQIFESPDNWETMNTLMGIPELVIPEAEARNRQKFEIEQLLKSAPIPPDPMMVDEAMKQHAAQSIIAQAQGLPEPPPFDPASLMKSSVPIDPIMENSVWHFKFCQDWWESPAYLRELAAGNTLGIQNVRLHAMEHYAVIQQQAAQAAVMGPPPEESAPAGKKPPAAKPKDHPQGAATPPGQPPPMNEAPLQ